MFVSSISKHNVLHTWSIISLVFVLFRFLEFCSVSPYDYYTVMNIIKAIIISIFLLESISSHYEYNYNRQC